MIIKAEYLNHFVSKTKEIFSEMFEVDLHRTEIQAKNEDVPRHFFSGVVGFSGNLQGIFSLSIDEEFAQWCTASLQEKETFTPQEIADTIRNLTHQVGSTALERFAEHKLTMGFPLVLSGDNVEVYHPQSAEPICVSFSSTRGQLSIEFELAEAIG